MSVCSQEGLRLTSPYRVGTHLPLPYSDPPIPYIYWQVGKLAFIWKAFLLETLNRCSFESKNSVECAIIVQEITFGKDSIGYIYGMVAIIKGIVICNMNRFKAADLQCSNMCWLKFDQWRRGNVIAWPHCTLVKMTQRHTYHYVIKQWNGDVTAWGCVLHCCGTHVHGEQFIEIV